MNILEYTLNTYPDPPYEVGRWEFHRLNPDTLFSETTFQPAKISIQEIINPFRLYIQVAMEYKRIYHLRKNAINLLQSDDSLDEIFTKIQILTEKIDRLIEETDRIEISVRQVTNHED